MSGARSRSKGARGEREARDAVRAAWGLDVIRAAQANGAHSADLVAPDGSRTPIHLEVKRYARISSLAWHRRAAQDAGPDATPIVLMREDRDTGWYALVKVEDVPALARSLPIR